MAEIAWDPPAPGVWFFEGEHMPRPVSGLMPKLFELSWRGGLSGALRRGHPPDSVVIGVINRYTYFSPRPVDVDVDELERAAAETLATSAWRADIAHWRAGLREEVISRSTELQDEDPEALDDAGLVDHLRRVVAHIADAGPIHFEHVTCGVAVGLFAEEAERWGITADDVLTLLAGCSTATSETTAYLDEIADAVADAGIVEMRGLDDIGSASLEARAALDRYLARYGWNLLTGFDVIDATVGEQPDLIVAAVRARLDADRRPRTAPADPSPWRSRVPEDERHRFDELLADARAAYGLRDDDVGPCYMWPYGLMRRALLAAGARLAAAGRIGHPDDVFEATGMDDVVSLIEGEGPGAEELAAAAAARRAAVTLVPPRLVGEPVPTAEREWGPSSGRLRALARGYQVDSARRTEGGLGGLGVGGGTYTGRARVADTASDALALLEPGEVLVTTMTTPAFNAVLPIAGAVAVATGGVMCHTAILARELGFPAVVGVSGLLDEVRTGDLVEVDAEQGVVRVLERAPESVAVS